MAQISTVAADPKRDIPKPKYTYQGRTFRARFSPTQLTANVTSGDNILLGTLPKDAQILDANVRFLGVSGLSLSFVQLRITENSVSYNLTNPLSATIAGALSIISAPPCTTTYVKTLELIVGGNSIDNTATGIIDVMVHYDKYQLAG